MTIEIKNVYKAFKKKQILTDFSLILPKSGVLCLVGNSGCGKTTLFNLINGLITPDRGRILGIEGLKISQVFQQPRLIPWLSASENIAAACGDNESSLRNAAIWLDAVGMGAEVNTLPAELSGGMQQRVAIARALCRGGDLLLLDEPFTGLDDINALSAINLIKKHFKDKPILAITHHIDEAKAISDKIIFLSGPPLRMVNSKTVPRMP